MIDQNGPITEEIQFESLSFRNWFTLAWAMFWRGIIIMIASAICGFIMGIILGALVGAICAGMDFPFETIKIPLMIIAYLLGTGIGFLFLIVQLKWFFKARFKDFRFALLKNT